MRISVCVFMCGIKIFVCMSVSIHKNIYSCIYTYTYIFRERERERESEKEKEKER